KRIGIWVLTMLLFGVGTNHIQASQVQWLQDVTWSVQETLKPGFGELLSFEQVKAELSVLEGRSETNFARLVKTINCKVSVSGKVSLGAVASVNITVEVSGPCDEIRKQGTALAKQVLNEISEALKR